MNSPYQNLKEVVQDILKVYNSGCSWKTKYDIIFDQAKRVRRITSGLGIHLEYVDPDTSYEDDVRAYVEALLEKVVPHVLRQTSKN